MNVTVKVNGVQLRAMIGVSSIKIGGLELNIMDHHVFEVTIPVGDTKKEIKKGKKK